MFWFFFLLETHPCCSVVSTTTNSVSRKFIF
jgi:hypothetical protein